VGGGVRGALIFSEAVHRLGQGLDGVDYAIQLFLELLLRRGCRCGLVSGNAQDECEDGVRVELEVGGSEFREGAWITVEKLLSSLYDREQCSRDALGGVTGKVRHGGGFTFF
jgi:hypothetical protein